ncbi:MAG: 7-carboxy-7-deazaguanine synthase QueE [bacterium]
MSAPVAQLNEVFNSIQGEGLYVGLRQTFIRFASCNLSCQYCDTDFVAKQSATVDELLTIVQSFDKPKGVNHSIAITGGEPLLQVDFLKEFLPKLKEQTGLPVYLETNGTLPDHLQEVIELVDIIALDFKLPSATGESAYWKEHKKSLEIAFMKEAFVKIVFTSETMAKEMMEAVRFIAEVDDNIPLILQPVTPHGPIKHRPLAEQIFAFHNIAKRQLKNVRVIPQTHKLLRLN